MVLFNVELNGLPSYTTDIGNAYLEVFTIEQLWLVAPPNFGSQAGNLLINKSLYGLRSSGQSFNKLLGDCLLELGFKQSKCESDIWISEKKNTNKANKVI